MKKHYLILAAIVLAVVTFTVVSCNKEKQEEGVVMNANLTEGVGETNMDEYLLSFKQKMLSAQKGDESIGLEQARQNLCDLLNFDFGDANLPTSVFEYDTLYVKLALTDGMVDLSQLAITYNKAFDLILASYRGLDLPEKSVYFIFCDFDDDGNKDGNAEEMRIVVCYRGLTRDLPSIHDTLSWQPGRMGTSCDDHSIPYGGAIVMQSWLGQARPGVSCEGGGRVYFTETQDWYKHGYDTFDETEGRYKVFTIFTYQIDTVCISHEDMEYYFTNILDYFHQETPISHVAIDEYVDDHRIPCPSTFFPGDCYYWTIRIRHAKPNCTGSGAVD